MKTALCLGSFDGLHKGHRAVLSVPDDYYKVVLTFKVPPKSVLNKENSLIMTLENKCQSLKDFGIDKVEVLDFLKVKDMPYDEFLLFLKERFNPSLISCGFNYRFGKKGLGNADNLRKFCKENDIIFRLVDEVNENNVTISSTLIRSYLQNGEIERANALLLKPFSFTSPVIEGDKRGRTIGFPTVNQKYPTELVKLKFGVYKTEVLIDGDTYCGITNIGKRPTYEIDYIISETYIENFSGDLYGKELTIIPLKFLREEKKFSSLYELKEQIKSDLEM